ncbi:MAG TPA: hypothetical protein VFO86_16405, partial [Terriglobia bacterium]|nr:hypothetical protein [Terriglobia bacterium]
DVKYFCLHCVDDVISPDPQLLKYVSVMTSANSNEAGLRRSIMDDRLNLPMVQQYTDDSCNSDRPGGQLRRCKQKASETAMIQTNLAVVIDSA